MMPDTLNKEDDVREKTSDVATRIDVGYCSKCGRKIHIKPGGLRKNVNLTCKCGHNNSIVVDQRILFQYGIIQTPIIEDIYQIKDTPLYRLLDGSRLRTMWAEAEANEMKCIEERWKDLPRQHWPAVSLPDIISISINPYALERNARASLNELISRMRTMDRARPWSIELYESVECAINGLLDAPFFIFLGMTGYDAYDVYKKIVHNIRSDHPCAQSGGEWEIYSQNQGNQWRSDRCARLIERWVFLDAGVIKTFVVPGITPPVGLTQ